MNSAWGVSSKFEIRHLKFSSLPITLPLTIGIGFGKLAAQSTRIPMASDPNTAESSLPAGKPIPESFLDYVKSMGPGIVVVLTWLGAGDIVESAMAGGNYGYALMWAFALCLLLRYCFVSIIAKYQLCNPRSESVMAGLTRLHPAFTVVVLAGSIIVGHAVGVFLLIGASEVCAKLSGTEEIRVWAIGITLFAFMLVMRPRYRRIEKVFLILAGLMSVCLIGLAVWAGPSPGGIARGVFGFDVPDTIGRFDAVTLAVAFVGAIAGGLANLMYPYFIREKGWVRPEHLKVQRYDLILGIIVLIILDLSIWVVGAEVLHPCGIKVTDLESLSKLLGETMGLMGTRLFYLGVWAALFTSIVGNGIAYGLLITDSYIHIRPAASAACGGEYKNHPGYLWSVYWIVLSPLIWVLFGKADFVGLTVMVNASQVVLLPVLVIGMWLLTSQVKFIGEKYCNRWWENAFIGFLLVTSLISTYFAITKFIAIVTS